MTTYISKRCTECDVLLWSNHARECGVCPECEEIDVDYSLDLEDRLEEALK